MLFQPLDLDEAGRVRGDQSPQHRTPARGCSGNRHRDGGVRQAKLAPVTCLRIGVMNAVGKEDVNRIAHRRDVSDPPELRRKRRRAGRIAGLVEIGKPLYQRLYVGLAGADDQPEDAFAARRVQLLDFRIGLRDRGERPCGRQHRQPADNPWRPRRVDHRIITASGCVAVSDGRLASGDREGAVPAAGAVCGAGRVTGRGWGRQPSTRRT